MPASFWLLLKKNIYVEVKSWKWLMIETLIVLSFMGIIMANPVATRHNYYRTLQLMRDIESYKDTTSLYNLSTLMGIKNIKPQHVRFKLVYSPVNNFTTYIVNATKYALQLRSIEGVNNTKDMEYYMSESEVLAGIEFHNIIDGELPEKLSVTLRFPSEFRTIKKYGAHMRNQLWVTRCSGIIHLDDADSYRNVDIYAREGFLQLQNRLFLEWVKLLKTMDEKNNEYNPNPLWIQQLSNKVETKMASNYFKNDIFENFQKLTPDFINKKANLQRIAIKNSFEKPIEPLKDINEVPTLILNSMRPLSSKHICSVEGYSNFNWFLWHFIFFIPFINIIWRLSREHQANIIAHHYIYGYEYYKHFFAHFIVSMVHLIIIDFYILIFILIEWTQDPNFYIFHKVPVYIVLTFFGLYNIILILYATCISHLFSNAVNATLCGVTMWIAAYSLFSVLLFHNYDIKIVFLISLCTFCNNFFPIGIRALKQLDLMDSYKVIYTILITEAVNIVILLLLIILTNYLKPPRYMSITNFLYSLICIRRRLQTNKSETIAAVDQVTFDSMSLYEPGPPMGKEVYSLRNVSTVYNIKGKEKHRLRNVTVKIYEGEITVFLGAHDNGKAKLISLLAGWSKPDTGNIFYNNKDIYKNWNSYRQNIDVCMVYNALFDMFTVGETLRYFGRTKQIVSNVAALKEEEQKWIRTLLRASINPNELVQDLSYGQKRLVALVCALLCDTHVILLHQPTQHMGDEHQRNYWRILRENKTNRVILMTTLSIDEAEEIGDRIAILSYGVVVAYGTPYYLKQTFTKGFDLIIRKEPTANDDAITEAINAIILDVEIDFTNNAELFYKLPREKKHLFQHMLLKLEYEKESLGIQNIQMYSSDFSEVYMTATTNHPNRTLQEDSRASHMARSLIFINETPGYLKRQDVNAMVYKKMIQQAPNVLPIAMIFLVLILILLINGLITVSDRPEIDYIVYVGLHPNSTDRTLFLDTENCSFIEVTDIEKNTKNTELGTTDFIITDIECGYTDYKEYFNELHDDHVRYGAIEISIPASSIILWSNDAIFHSAPLTMNVAHNFILQQLFPKKINRTTSITNKPLEVPLHVQVNLINNQVTHLRVPLTMGTIMPITLACFVTPVIEERHTNLMSLQRIAGVHINVFYVVGLLWDLCTFFIFSILYMMAMALTTIEGFNNISKLLTLLLLNVHAVGILSMMYLLASFMNKSKVRAFFQATLVQFVTGLSAYVFYWDVLEAHRVFYTIASLSPTFSLLEGISRLYILSVQKNYCENRCNKLKYCNENTLCIMLPHCCTANYFTIESPGILSCLLVMLLSASVFGALFFLQYVYYTEKKYKLPLYLRKKGLGVVVYRYDDEDVTRERIRIAEMSMAECVKYSVLADQLERRIPAHGKRLDTVSFAIGRYMSMGIYGAHKSGKSHLINQLAGVHGFRYGELYLNGKDIKYHTRDALLTVGFCPDDSHVCGTLTPRQLFNLLLMIRGVPKEDIINKLRELNSVFGLSLFMNARLEDLSRAIRRRVTIAASLIIYKGILILDEPCYGMPAFERRLIWNILHYARACGKTIILSSNDSLECQRLTDFLIVADNGDMLAIGSVRYLRQKYDNGFYLLVKLHIDGSTLEEASENLDRDVENFVRFAAFLHEDAELISRKMNFIIVHVPVAEITFSYLYGSIEKNYRRLNISSYIIKQASLNEVLEKILARKFLREPFRKGKSRSTLRKTKLMNIL